MMVGLIMKLDLDEDVKMVEIELTQGKVTIVDDIDSDLNLKKWCAHKDRNVFYALRGKPHIKMHRVILGRMLGRELEKGEQVDHKNHDGLDNRRENLRLATGTENCRNRSKRKGASMFKGVCWNKLRCKWQANITIDGRSKHLGRFDSEMDAARAYDKAAIRMFASFCSLNFPMSNYLTPESITV